MFTFLSEVLFSKADTKPPTPLPVFLSWLVYNFVFPASSLANQQANLVFLAGNRIGVASETCKRSKATVVRPVDSWTGMGGGGGMDSQCKLLSELLSDQAAFITSPKSSLANYWGALPCPPAPSVYGPAVVCHGPRKLEAHDSSTFLRYKNLCDTKSKVFENASKDAFPWVLENQNTKFSLRRPPWRRLRVILNIAQFWPPHFENQCAGPSCIRTSRSDLKLVGAKTTFTQGLWNGSIWNRSV